MLPRGITSRWYMPCFGKANFIPEALAHFSLRSCAQRIEARAAGCFRERFERVLAVVRIPQLALLSERRLDSAARPIREKGQHALFRR